MKAGARRCFPVLCVRRCSTTVKVISFVLLVVLSLTALHTWRSTTGFPEVPQPLLDEFPYTFGALFCSNGRHGRCPIPIRLDRPSPAFYAAVEKEVMKLHVPALLHMHYDDSDLLWRYCKPTNLHHRVEELTDVIFWLSWNPRVDLATGSVVGRRTIPIPDFETFNGIAAFSPAASYRHRTKGLIVWRGSTTGCPLYGEDYMQSDRARTVSAFHKYSPRREEGTADLLIDVKFSDLVQNATSVSSEMFGSRMDRGDMLGFKAVIDVDGNANAWSSLQWKLASGLCVLKVRSTTGFVQWYYRHLQHGVHVWLLDVSNPETMVSEAIRVAQNETLCSTLAQNSMAFAKRYFTPSANRAWLQHAIQSVDEDTLRHVDWRIQENIAH